MKKLVLIRHAKSSWDTIMIDKERPLSKRGIMDAHKVSTILNDQLPDKYIIWSSIAKRATETAVIFGQNMDLNLDCIILKPEIYTFESKVLEKAIKSCPNSHDTLILFGHNNAITKFVNKFGNLFYNNIPTSGVVIINFDTDNWEDIENGTIELTIFPRDINNNEQQNT
ncbi:SixA phosphatase family protein [Myroides sp. LJL115]